MKKLLNTLLKTSTVKLSLFQTNKARFFLILLGVFLPVYFLLHLFSGSLESSRFYILNTFFKLRYHITGQTKISPDLRFFTIDDEDVENLGIEKNEREVFAGFLTILKEAGVKTAAFDIVFKENESEHFDRILVKRTGEAGGIFYPVILNTGEKDGPFGTQKKQILQKITIFPATEGQIPSFVSGDFISPFFDLTMSAKGLGSIDIVPDNDGITRTIPLIRAFEKGYIPSLALNSICHFFDVHPGNIIISFGQHITLPAARHPDGRIQDIQIPIDSEGRMFINYTGPWNNLKQGYTGRALFKTARERKADLSIVLKNRFIILTDISSINKEYNRGIFDAVYPHSGILINAVNTILTGNYLKNPASCELAFWPLFCILILWLSAVRLKTIPFIFSTGSCCLLLIGIESTLFISLGRLPDLLPSLSAVLVSGTALVLYKIRLLSAREKVAYHKYQKSQQLVLEKELKITLLEQENQIENIRHRNSLVELFSQYGISKREGEIIVHLKLGKERKIIGKDLKISENTVNTHLRRIFDKCNVSNKTELLRLFRSDPG